MTAVVQAGIRWSVMINLSGIYRSVFSEAGLFHVVDSRDSEGGARQLSRAPSPCRLSLADVILAMRSVLRGEIYLSADIALKILTGVFAAKGLTGVAQLTDRELEIFLANRLWRTDQGNCRTAPSRTPHCRDVS